MQTCLPSVTLQEEMKMNPSLKQLAGQRKEKANIPREAQQRVLEASAGELSFPARSKPTTRKPTAISSSYIPESPKAALPSSPLIPEFPSIKNFNCNNNIFKDWVDVQVKECAKQQGKTVDHRSLAVIFK